MSPQYLSYPTWEEIYGERPSYEGFLKEVRQFDKVQTAWLLSRLNMLLAVARFHSEDAIAVQRRMLGWFVDEGLFEKMKSAYGGERFIERRPFHSLQLLLLLKLVLLEGGKTGLVDRMPIGMLAMRWVGA